MKLINRQELAKTAACRWNKLYNKFDYFDPEKHDIFFRLKSLGSNPDPDKVDEIIGNYTWTRRTCDECQKNDAEKWVEFDPDPGTPEMHLCEDCLKQALVLIEEKDDE